MVLKEQAYVRLQQHLDRQPVGFPATRSGAEIKVLKHIFTPEEAEIATCLSYKPEPLAIVYGRAAKLVDSRQELAQILDRIEKNGGIEITVVNGEKHYFNVPLVVGMYEMQIGRLTPEFIRDYNAYVSDRKFGIEFLSTELPQMRTIPVARSITVQNHVSTYDEIKVLLNRAEAPFAILECICRKKKALEGKPCTATDRKETCLAMGSVAGAFISNGHAREIDRQEAMSIIEQNQEQGLVLQPSNTQQATFICSCCGCCCGMLQIQKMLPKPLDFWATNFHADVDETVCGGCGLCQERCHVKAVCVDAHEEHALVDLDRCLGCGVCVTVCPHGAISLTSRPTQVKPPRTRAELYDTIMAKKKNSLQKTQLMAKLLFERTQAKRKGKQKASK